MPDNTTTFEQVQTKNNGNTHELDRVPLNGSRHSKRATAQRTSTVLAWKWELILLLLAAVAIIALVIVLIVEDGTRQRQWGLLTLNAINTALTTVAMSAIAASVGSALAQNMWNHHSQRSSGRIHTATKPASDLRALDGASRGPFGSLLLLGNRRAGWVAVLGALVTILNLAFSTFTQQLIGTRIHNKTIGIATPFARSQHFEVADVGTPTTGVKKRDVILPSNDPQVLLDFSMQAIIVGAGLQGNNAPQLAPGCRTGNCTYTTSIPTLAVCGQCTDITNKLDHSNSCYYCAENDDACAGKESDCIYNLPNAHRLAVQPRINGDTSDAQFAIFNATSLLGDLDGYDDMSERALEALVYTDQDQNGNARNIQYLMKIETIGITPEVANQSNFMPGTGTGNGNNHVSGTMPPVEAHECALWMCLNYYNVSVSNGTVHANITHSDSDAWQQGGYSFEDGNGNVYKWNSVAVAALSYTISNLVPTSNSFVVPSNNLQFQYSFGDRSSNFNLVQGLWYHSGDLQNWTTNLANAISRGMADTQRADDTNEFDGEMSQSETIFHIRWYWISLPVVVFVLASCFLTATIIQTNRRLVEPWRADALALVIAGLDETAKLDMAKTDDLHSIASNSAAGQLRIGLRQRPNGDGMVFSADEPE